MRIKKLHVMSNSHLDREHRHAFQETRIMLVQMMDELIDIMEKDPEYKYFTLDGQSIVLHDYLEVKPQMKDRLHKLIKEKRILIGPWYSLVDCFSVLPESIIRNLLVGKEVCSEFDEPMNLGYSIFSFGQMAQLPQIYAGFGIKDIVFYKSASKEAMPQSEFIWCAPDGTEAFATRLGREARWNFYFDFSLPVILGGNAKKPGWQSKFTEEVRLCHMNDEKFVKTYATEVQPDIRIREELIEESVTAVMGFLDESASENVFLAFEGTDFTSPLKDIPEAIKAANRIMDGKVNLVHSNPLLYFQEVKEDINQDSLVKYKGEMRFGPVNRVHCETMGTNTEIKQAMFHAENTIIYYAEPLSSFLMVNGGKYEKEVLDLAWRYLLAAQAHDSVHGSGDPKIKTDNLNRLEQVQEIADSITRRAVDGLAGLIDMSESEKGDMVIAVFNTTPYLRSDMMKITIDLPSEELVKDYWLEDLNGERVEFYQLARYNFNLAMIHRAYRPKSVYSDRIELLVDVKDIPSMGYKLLKVKRVKGSTETSTNPFPLGYFPYNPIAISGNVLDNGLIRVIVDNDGTLRVHDYETKRDIKGLNAFTDIGSSGDFWVHREPYCNRIISSKGSNAQIELIRNSGLSATYRIVVKMDIPESLTQDKMSRSRHTICTEIVSEVTVNRGSKRIDFKTSLNNNSKDHMLVVSFPTEIQTEDAYWEAPFEIRKRDVDKFTNDNGKKGPELERNALQSFVDISDGTNGMALFTKGLREVGTVNEKGAVINLTLFRAASGTFPIHNDLLIGFEKETSQCIGEQCFEYAIMLHKGGINEGNVIEASRKYTIPLISAQIGSGKGGSLKGDTCFMGLKGNQ
ncbi:MAG: hypothetical protein H7X94_14895, partial [Vallitaleaceae bacterium]|nr:hypothetical protein [Vallitaleaceae bacterium]